MKNEASVALKLHALVIDDSGGGRGDHPPLVAENFVCSNSNFSPTGAITPPPLSGPPWPSHTPPPPPFRKSCIRAWMMNPFGLYGTLYNPNLRDFHIQSRVVKT